MNVKFRRFFAAFSLVALVSVLAAAPANAADAPTGVGSAGGTVSLVSVDYGDIIKAALLGENNSDTIDPLAGTPTATETLSPLSVHSVTIPALDALTVTPVQTTSTGAVDQKDTTLLDLSTLGVPGVTGVVNPATLSSLVDTDGAKSALTSTLADLGVLGIVGVDSASIDLGGLAGPNASTANRAVTANALTVLDLQALLNLLGLNIGDLSLQQVADLLDQLGELDAVNAILGTSFANPGDIQSAVTALNAAIDLAQLTLDAKLADLVGPQALFDICMGLPADEATCDLVSGLGVAQALVAAAHLAVDNLQADLDELLQTIVDVLTGTPLLAIDGVQAGAVATATDTVANSAATVTAAINDIRVGGIDLNGINANTTLDQVVELANLATTTLNGVLETIDPSLANLLSVKLFQRSTSVAQNGDYVQALAGITALELTITPPDICAVVNNVLGATPISSLTEGLTLPATPVTDVLDALGSIVPDCFQFNPASLQAQAIPEGAVAALTGPITFKAASVNSVAEFKVVQSTTSTTDTGDALPRTGMNGTLLLVIGGLMAAAALGLRRVSAPVKARARK